MTGGSDDRWVEVTPSQFPHEAEGLSLVRAVLPDETPFRAWSNFEFRDSRGKWHEVDLLVLGRRQLHLIELKYYSGLLRGDDHQWLRPGKRAEDSPLKLARRKAQYFATKLKDELRTWAHETGVQIPRERDVVPFVQESVFLHHPSFRSELSEASAIGLYGLDGAEDTSNLPGISELVLEQPDRRAIGANQEQILAALMARIGLVQRRERSAGSWIIEDQALAEGEGWQEWLASHQIARQERGRIRFQVTAPGATEQERTRVRRIAEHEFRVMSRLQHDGLLRPRDMVESDLGVGLVYPYDESWERLDLWTAGQPNGVPLTTQLSIVRQVGEALQYAHGNKIVHRGLSPRAIWVKSLTGSDTDVKVRLGDWQAAGTIDASSLTRSAATGVTSLFGAAAPAAAQAAAAHQPGTGGSVDAAQDGQAAGRPADADRWLSEAFQAPEGTWNPSADRVRLDVFGIGALAFYVIAGRPAAANAQALRTRLRDQDGLDLAVELPQVSSELRSLVLRATKPAVTQRTADVSTFLAQLATAERAANTADSIAEDPLEAAPGTVLDGRFRLERRLGQGSTAVGLLVTDLLSPGGEVERVLKVALHDDAAARLADEAEVLRALNSPRLVKLVDGPLVVGGRQSLLLESAGTETLTEVLRARQRMSLDLLERYGTDLLDALVALDKAGVDHRDIKPSNLGVRENRGDRTKHLVLFDFSLTRAAASATSAGTPPYLDPFLTGKRNSYDSAAERYSAAVVLFEMATGMTPVYGDGESDPASVTDEARIESAMFDPALAPLLTEFFTAALARDVGKRHDTSEAMRATWQAMFVREATTEPDEAADQLAAAATLATPLRESGLTARALSALEPYAVATVGELLTVDPVRLSRLQGVANATRLQISRRIKEWRERLGDPTAARPATDSRLALEDAADLLLRTSGGKRSRNRGSLVRLVLGVGTELDAFATHAQLAANLPETVSTARATQLMASLQESWAGDDEARALLDDLAQAVIERLDELGDVATVQELVVVVVARCGGGQAEQDGRLAEGLLRLAVDRVRALGRADAPVRLIYPRRRDGRVVLLAHHPSLHELAESLAAEADKLVETVGDPLTAVVPASRVASTLEAAVARAALDDVPRSLRDSSRLVRLAAGLSSTAAASGAGELHHRDLPQLAALTLTFKGFGGAQQLAPAEIRERVRVRFPAVPALPERPRLDELVLQAGLALIYDDRRGVYRSAQGSTDTTGLESRQATRLAAATSPVATGGAISHRLEESISRRSFVALGVPATRGDRLVEAVQSRYAASVVDVTGVLLGALKAESEKVGLPWATVRAADAQPQESRARKGLDELVKRSWGTVADAVETALASAELDGPVLLTEASPLARYDNVGLLARWSDLGISRRRAVWLVVPQLGANQGAMLDGRPVPLAAPSQFVALDMEWIDSLAGATAAAAVKES